MKKKASDNKILILQCIVHHGYECEFILINNQIVNNFEFTLKLRHLKSKNECFFGADDTKKIIESLFNMYVTEISRMEPFIYINSDISKREFCIEISNEIIDVYDKTNTIEKFAASLCELLRDAKYGKSYAKHEYNTLFSLLEKIGCAITPILFVRLTTLALSNKIIKTEFDHFDKGVKIFIEKLCLPQNLINK